MPDSTSSPATGAGIHHAVIAGVVTAVVGFTSSFAVVLAGLTAVGASPQQAASGLLVLCVTMGAGSLFFSLRYRMPITMAWSTPGAALLAGATAPSVGFGGAVTAFALSGLLLAACGLIRPLGQLVGKIPPALANAMLAGVLLTLCIAPFTAVVANPAAIAPVIVAWLLVSRFAPRWAVPVALAVALVVIVLSGSLTHLTDVRLGPIVEISSPAWDPAAIVALAIPLFLVTMTSQNIPGVAVLASFGYQAPVAQALIYTGLASTGGAFLGGHAINLAAISAALAAGPQAHPDPRKRWIAGATTGVAYAAFGPLSALITAVARAAPAGLMETIAGLALIGTFAAAARAALTDTRHRDAGAVTFVIAASGVTIAGIGAAFWALAGGAVYLLVMHTSRPSRSRSSKH
ncbi:MAG: benzoate/H(+) symporter BenE family transporter [Nakamurella sp.]